MDTTLEHFQKLFKDFGVVTNVKWPLKRSPGCHVHVSFEDEESIDEILSSKDTFEWSLEEQGLTKYVNEFQRPDIQLLKEKVDEAMALFEDQERLERERERVLVDEDGFTLVTKSKKRGHKSDGTTVFSITKEEAEKLKPKEKKLVNFYRFQQRERKRDEVKELRRKFEEDKKRVELLKQQRRFKPF